MKKTLIVYTTNHGTTEKAAKMISDHLSGSAQMINIKKEKIPDVNLYDQVIIGGSIYAGKTGRRLIRFCRENLDILIKKNIALFICCFEQSPKREEQFAASFPVELRRVSLIDGFFGGEFIVNDMNFFEKLVVKKVASAKSSVSFFDKEAVGVFAEGFRRRCEF